ncbi:S-adenosyl-L-methionine-dependent methyltransferase [Aspergillus alliaceus]|uniref:Velvet complex subunit laeA n=1 Tax=Petromyces alliaceus TaxID=209559 RepID=A0A5N7BRM5_PETAA|nr:S-adenosyl-L-methionine-dependent methyltransferase [Aspergillus alliaceus]
MYRTFRRGVYSLPCDEQEQDRLNIFHKLFTVAKVSDRLIYAPYPRNGRLLDLGCGTGIWSIDMANKYPEAFVVGVDLAPIQPPNHLPNCEFYAPFDFESCWAMGEESIFSHLRAGAWFEQVEIDFKPRCDDRLLDRLALRQWYKLLKQAMQDLMRPVAYSSRETIQDLQEAGFIEVDHQMVGLPLNPWHQDGHERKVARWYNLAILESTPGINVVLSVWIGRTLEWYRLPATRTEQMVHDAHQE